jgi:hypothetical protein
MGAVGIHRGFLALEGPTLAAGIPLDLTRWEREADLRVVPALVPGWRSFVEELWSILRPAVGVDPRTARLRWLGREA